MDTIKSLTALFATTLTVLCAVAAQAEDHAATTAADQKSQVNPRQLPDSYWKQKLAPEVYQVTRCSNTETAFTGKYWNNHKTGIYRCSNCGAVLFDSKDKFDSGTGWPSFIRTKGNSVEEHVDKSLGMVRDEVVCKHCGAHLGHLFPDGPATGQRFCINSASLDFKEENAKNTTTGAH